MAHLVITIGCEYGAKGNQIGKGITLDVRAIPGERSRDGLELLAKYAAM